VGRDLVGLKEFRKTGLIKLCYILEIFYLFAKRVL
jgi:hypothetical protein